MFRNEPSAKTMSKDLTAVAKFPLLLPEPWVPVAMAPAIEMWGSYARL